MYVLLLSTYCDEILTYTYLLKFNIMGWFYSLLHDSALSVFRNSNFIRYTRTRCFPMTIYWEIFAKKNADFPPLFFLDDSTEISEF